MTRHSLYDAFDHVDPEPTAAFRDGLRAQLLDELVAPDAAIRQRIDEQNITEPTLEVIMLSPERNESPTTNHRWMIVAAAVTALVLVGGLIFAATRADEDPVPADQPELTVPPEPVDETADTVLAEPSVLVNGVVLSSGQRYRTDDFEVPFELSVPASIDGDLTVRRATDYGVLMVLTVEPRNPEVPPSQAPGFQIGTVPEGVSVDDIVQAGIKRAESTDTFEAEVESGTLRGQEVTILRARSTQQSGFESQIQTSPQSRLYVSDGERDIVWFMFEADGHPMIAAFDAHPLQYDLALTNFLELIEAIEFI